jgi:hypothetical protein
MDTLTVLPIDLTAIVGIISGTLFLLIPVAGFTARFAIKPIVEALARHKESQGSNAEVRLLEQRVALLEQQLQSIETSVARLVEKKEFDRQLTGPGA